MNLKSQEEVCKNKDFCGIVMPSKKNKILEFNQCMKSDKIPYIVYADIQSFILKIDGCANNPEKSSIINIGEHIPCGYSISTIWGFDHIENKHALYRGTDCMKKLCDSLREHAKNINEFENKKNATVNKKRTKITSRCKSIYSKNYRKVKDKSLYR